MRETTLKRPGKPVAPPQVPKKPTGEVMTLPDSEESGIQIVEGASNWKFVPTHRLGDEYLTKRMDSTGRIYYVLSINNARFSIAGREDELTEVEVEDLPEAPMEIRLPRAAYTAAIMCMVNPGGYSERPGNYIAHKVSETTATVMIPRSRYGGHRKILVSLPDYMLFPIVQEPETEDGEQTGI